MWLVTVFLVAAIAFGDTSPVMSTYDTIIVDLGASGCSAASVLSQAGKKVLGLEAQDRIGGRVHTVPFGNGVVELGAEWIHGEVQSRVYEIAIANNITIVPQTDGVDVYGSDGSLYNRDIFYELVEHTLNLSYPLDSIKQPQPLGAYYTKELMEYIRNNHSEILNEQDYLKSVFRYIELLICSYEACDSWDDVTTHGTFQGLKGNLYMSWHKYGYKTLFEILLNTYNKGSGLPNFDVKLRKVVTHISYPTSSDKDVVVTCGDGSTYRARNVIVRVSLGVLKERYTSLFTPALPTNKVNSLNNIAFGVVGKIIFNFDQVWWNSNNFACLWKEDDLKQIPREDMWTTKLLGPAIIMGSNSSITLWSNGETTRFIENLPEDVLKTKLMAFIRRFLGKNTTIPEPKAMLRTTWYSNPYTRGTYSYDNLEAPQHPGARSILAEPIVDSSGAPRVLFAGEASNSIHYSTVHGAVETGFREANRLLSIRTR